MAEVNDEFQGLTHPMLKTICGQRNRRMFFRQKVVERQGRTCPVCERELRTQGAVLERTIPEDQGGAETWENVKAVHSYCTHRHLQTRTAKAAGDE